MKTTTQPTSVTALPRIALFLAEPKVQQELETILRESYSSLLIVTAREKLTEFDVPFIVVVDSITEIPKVLELHPLSGTQMLVILNDQDSEIVSAAFEAGADDYIPYPFEAKTVVTKMEKYLQQYR